MFKLRHCGSNDFVAESGDAHDLSYVGISYDLVPGWTNPYAMTFEDREKAEVVAKRVEDEEGLRIDIEEV